MKGYVKRDDDGKIIIDNSGFITITCEDESVIFQLHLSEIDDKAEQMCFNVNGKDVYLDVYPGWETAENDSLMEAENENENEIEGDIKNTPSTSKSGNVVFPWCDASTKIFLREYKLKKELVKNRKLKNMKVAYQDISKSLQDNGFNVSPLQVENRFKTLKRAYKNMLLSNRRTGRGRYICSYEQDLDEIFSAKSLLPEDTEINGEASAEATASGFTQIKDDPNSFMRSSALSIESLHNLNKISESNARMEAQHVKLLDNLQNCLRTLKSLTTKMESRTKNLNDIENKILQVQLEMRDMQREEYNRVEKQRQKAYEQREKTNSLLEEVVKLLQLKKET